MGRLETADPLAGKTHLVSRLQFSDVQVAQADVAIVLRAGILIISATKIPIGRGLSYKSDGGIRVESELQR